MSGYGTYLNLVIVGLILIICRGPQLTAQEMVVPPSEDTLYQRLIYLDSIVKEMDKKLSERETEDELLKREIFVTLKEARVLVERWRWEYNHIRPHSSLGYRPPAPETKTPVELTL